MLISRRLSKSKFKRQLLHTDLPAVPPKSNVKIRFCEIIQNIPETGSQTLSSVSPSSDLVEQSSDVAGVKEECTGLRQGLQNDYPYQYGGGIIIMTPPVTGNTIASSPYFFPDDMASESTPFLTAVWRAEKYLKNFEKDMSYYDGIQGDSSALDKDESRITELEESGSEVEASSEPIANENIFSPAPIENITDLIDNLDLSFRPRLCRSKSMHIPSRQLSIPKRLLRRLSEKGTRSRSSPNDKEKEAGSKPKTRSLKNSNAHVNSRPDTSSLVQPLKTQRIKAILAATHTEPEIPSSMTKEAPRLCMAAEKPSTKIPRIRRFNKIPSPADNPKPLPSFLELIKRKLKSVSNFHQRKSRFFTSIGGALRDVRYYHHRGPSSYCRNKSHVEKQN